MSIFVDKTPVAVSIDGENVIHIRARMGYAVEQAVIGSATKFQQGRKSNSETGEDDAGQTVEVNIGAYNTALLRLNILRWEGPVFGGIPCTPENIDQLDSEDPLVAKVLEEIATRNKSKKAASNGNGVLPSGEGDQATVIDGEYTVMAKGKSKSPN